MSIFGAIGTKASRSAVSKIIVIAAMIFAFTGMSGTSGALAASNANDDPEEATLEETLPDPASSATNPLSDAGTSGYHLYRRHCQSCHGFLGYGSKKAAALTQTRYSKEHASRKDFHNGFRHGSRDHSKVARGTRKKPGPKFNDLELIAKFLREVDAWHTMLEQVGTN